MDFYVELCIGVNQIDRLFRCLSEVPCRGFVYRTILVVVPASGGWQLVDQYTGASLCLGGFLAFMWKLNCDLWLEVATRSLSWLQGCEDGRLFTQEGWPCLCELGEADPDIELSLALVG